MTTPPPRPAVNGQRVRVVAVESSVDTAHAAAGWPRGELLEVALTVVAGGVGAPLLIVLVGRYGWPVWWLVVAGVLLAWTGGAVWILGSHVATRLRVRRAARRLARHRLRAVRALPDPPPTEPGDYR